MKVTFNLEVEIDDQLEPLNHVYWASLLQDAIRHYAKGRSSLQYATITPVQPYKPPFLLLTPERQEALVEWCEAGGILESAREEPLYVTTAILCTYDQDMIDEELEAMDEYTRCHEEANDNE